jgi:four helix bundle protein
MRDPNKMRVADMAMTVALLTYPLTRLLPTDERNGLVIQMRKAAVSIGSCITEGCGRNTDAQFLNFLQMAMGSACELEFQTRLIERLHMVSEAQARPLQEALLSTKKMLAKLSSGLRG